MQNKAENEHDNDLLLNAIAAVLSKGERPLPEQLRIAAARAIVEAASRWLPENTLDKHIPLDVIALMEQGLMSVPLAPEYELHRLVCERCAQNYSYAKSHMGNVDAIKDSGKPIWKTLKRNSGLYKSRMLDALNVSNRIFVVSGEIIEDVFDEELCKAIDAYAKSGKDFTMLAGPMIELRRDGKGRNHFVDMVDADETYRINLYTADRRQSLHFAYSDALGFIYLEAPHNSAGKERDYLFPEAVASDEFRNSVYERYVRDRFDAAFKSPDVRISGKSDDFILCNEESLEEIGKLLEETGLSNFGRFGIEAYFKIQDQIV